MTRPLTATTEPMTSVLPSTTGPRAFTYGVSAARTAGRSRVSCRLDFDSSAWTDSPSFACNCPCLCETLVQTAPCDPLRPRPSDEELLLARLIDDTLPVLLPT